MSTTYDHRAIEKKWQAAWEKQKIWEVSGKDSPENIYVLDMFPYPSAEGLHVGHPEGYTASDIMSRYFRMKGKNVLHPMGFDSFGLPAENYAIKTGTHPATTTAKNIENMRKQIKALGFSYDWSREVITSDPEYYKWTQWIFIQLFKHGLAYEADAPINWCPSCKTGLANEEVVSGKCERCGTEVTKKQIKQWLVKITDEKYIERLLNDLDRDDIEWPESIKHLQRNWIGKSEGAIINFEVIATPSVAEGEAISKLNEEKIAASPSAPRNDKRKKILIGTRNVAKIEMIKAAFENSLEFEFVSLNDIPQVDDSTLQEGEDFLQNAKLKSEFYFKQTGIPTISTDNIFWIEKWPEDDGVIFHIRKLANPKSERATDEEVITWYKKFLTEHGGSSKARFHYAIAYSDVHGTEVYESQQRDYILQQERSSSFTEGYPTEALLKDADTGEFKVSQDLNTRYQNAFDLLQTTIRHRMISEPNKSIKVFTTRPDTLFGATYMVLSPEHELVDKITTDKQYKEVHSYQKKAAGKSDLERTDLAKDKTGVFTGAYAINPVNDKKIPIWIADYVLSSYGTGAIMAVPAHDERDYEFATKFKLPIIEVIKPPRVMPKMHPPMGSAAAWGMQDSDIEYKCWIGDGEMINSGEFDGLDSEEFKKKITEWLEKNKVGKRAVNYKLRDWLFSRQRYWGEPIPIVHCEKCGHVPVPEKDLPLELPDIKKYEPTGTGESPLAAVSDWVNTKCPECGSQAKRETNTMPQWAGSNWYFLRYCDPHNKKKLADPEKLKAWLPIDLYIGGAEHAVLHLLYARFIYKFLFDIKVIPEECGDEPFTKLKNQGLIMGEDGVKMSKSRGNVINPDEVIEKYGADTMRMYEMFMGPFEDAKQWDTKGIIGVKRFLDKIWEMVSNVVEDRHALQTQNDSDALRKQNQLIQKISQDIEKFKFNTAISSFMEYINYLRSRGNITRIELTVLLKLIHPFAPHITSELAELMQKNNKNKINIWDGWLRVDEDNIKDKEIKYVVQVNGKLRDNILVPVEMSEDEVKKVAQARDKVKKHLTTEPKKIIFVPGKLINFVV